MIQRATNLYGLVVCFVAPFLQSVPLDAQAPDAVVLAEHIYTADSARPTVDAIAIRGGRIVFTGSRQAALATKGPGTHVLDFSGRTIVPGIADAHSHLLSLGRSLQNVDLAGATSYQEVIRRVVARAHRTPPGAWILGCGWDQNRWPRAEFPIHTALSRAVPDHPVVLGRVDGHALLANARAMTLAGLSAATPDPAGGRIVRDSTSKAPTGVFIDNAMGLITRAEPPLSDEEQREALLAAIAEANRWGLVSVHDAGESERTLGILTDLAKRGRLTLRVYAMVSDDSAALAHYFARGPQSALADGRLWIRAVKLYADGALGSRGATRPLQRRSGEHRPGRDTARASRGRVGARAPSGIPGGHPRHR